MSKGLEISYINLLKDGNAVVIFLRPQSIAKRVPAPIFETALTGNDKLIGILGAKNKMAYPIRPGKHLFMVMGEDPAFLEATLDAGKIYYVQVSPEIGSLKANFVFKPVDCRRISVHKLRKWYFKCELVEKKPEIEKWYEENERNINFSRITGLEKWNAIPQKNKPALLPEFGE